MYSKNTMGVPEGLQNANNCKWLYPYERGKIHIQALA